MSKLNNIKIFIFLIVVFLVLNSCAKLSPSGFWKNFNSQLIENKSSNQGPFGGTRIVKWNNIDGKIKSKDFLKFANENGWNLIDSIEIQSKKINEIELKKIDKYAIEVIEQEILPELQDENSKIYIFKTGWIRVKPGNEIETEQNGFLISNSNNKSFEVIQKWGE